LVSSCRVIIVLVNFTKLRTSHFKNVVIELLRPLHIRNAFDFGLVLVLSDQVFYLYNLVNALKVMLSLPSKRFFTGRPLFLSGKVQCNLKFLVFKIFHRVLQYSVVFVHFLALMFMVDAT
jgi:hypothetical protein